MQISNEKEDIFDRIGLPSKLIWAFIGLLVFILGATIESSWFSSYLSGVGFGAAQVSLVFTIYGVVVALVSWFTGIGTQIWGIRKLMWLGTILYFVGSIPLLLIALPMKSYILILLCYAIRALAYPLFAYSFLVWINYSVKKEVLARATAWFWIFFGGGMTIIGPYLSSALFPIVGRVGVLYLGLAFVLIGAFCSLILNHDHVTLPKSQQPPMKDFTDGILIMFKRPRLGLSVIVKTINDIGKFGYVIVMPLYLKQFGFSTSEWLTVWGSINIVNIFANYVFGYIGDKIGWRKTVTYFAGTLCGVGTFGMYLMPKMFGHSIPLLFLSLCLYAIGLSAFGPLSALIPNLAPDKKGAAISALNLGSGMSNFVGPLIVSIFIGPFGSGGALIAIGVVYLLGSFLASFLKTPEELAGHKSVKHIAETKNNVSISNAISIDAEKFSLSVLNSSVLNVQGMTDEEIAKKKLKLYLVSHLLIDRFNCLENQSFSDPEEVDNLITNIKFTR
ncbi:MFS transporter [Liquorilactobacillus sicerae]|uniref:MFS transporter n=1 Tax=Liquorilactobacillus sicerae TaxID=1416943 RepID=UPI0024818B8A|nr:MFS transporter [Liquorilactobacillus sicerae]